MYCLYRFAPQEEGNIPYVIDNGVGTFEVHPPKIAHIMHRWLMGNHEDQHEHKQMAHRWEGGQGSRK